MTTSPPLSQDNGGDPPHRRYENPRYLTADTLAYIEKFVDEAPPLTPGQRDRLAVLLRPVEPPRED